MKEIHSPASAGAMIRSILVFGIIACFAFLFIKDGFVGYSRKNAQELVRSLGLPGEPLPAINATLTAQEGRRIIDHASPDRDIKSLTEQLGKPSLQHNDVLYFLGPGGHIRASVRGQRLIEIEWVRGGKSDTDLLAQQWIGYALSAAAAFFLFRLVRVLSLRTHLTPKNLRPPGKPAISLEAITEVTAKDFERNGCVMLHYQENGKPKRLILDGYFIRDLREIVGVIAQYRQLANPLKPSTEQE